MKKHHHVKNVITYCSHQFMTFLLILLRGTAQKNWRNFTVWSFTEEMLNSFIVLKPYYRRPITQHICYVR